MFATLITDALISIFAFLDNIVYGIIGIIYEVLMRIADATFFNQDTFQAFSTRLYSLLGIFMLFKLVFSLITYTINPDDLFEKSKGVQNLIGRVLIALLLLIATPTIFARARELQMIILNNSVIESVILGIGANSNASAVEGGNIGGVGDSKSTAGTRLSFVLLSTFLKPNATFLNCKGGMYLTTGVNPSCLSDLNAIETKENIPVGTYVDTAWKYKDVSIILDQALLQSTMKDGTQKIMDYKYLISTIAGGFVVYILIIFCIDVGVRSIKLGFLELVAPIPIISYIDPKASKDGAFNKWAKTCLSTYLDLFLRLAAIYFAVFIFDNINLLTGVTNNVGIDLAVKAFIIIGALLFAKQLPDLLKDIFPGMGKDSFNLSLKKKLGEVPGLKTAAGVTTGLGLTAAAGLGAFAASTADRLRQPGVGNKLMAPLSGLRNAGSAMRRGMGASLTGKKPKDVWGKSYGGAMDAHANRRTARAAGATALGTAATRLQTGLHMSTSADKIKSRIDDYKSYTDKAKSILDLAGNEMIKGQYDNMSFKDADGELTTMADYKINKSRFEIMGKADTTNWGAERLHNYMAEKNKLEGYIKKTEKNAQQAFVTQTIDGSYEIDKETKTQIVSQVSSLQRMVGSSTDTDLHAQDISGEVFVDDKGFKTGAGERLKKSMDVITATSVELDNAAKTAVDRANAEAAKARSGGGGKK